MQTCLNIGCLQIWKISQELILADALGKHFKNVTDPDPQPTNTGTPTTLTWIEGNALLKIP